MPMKSVALAATNSALNAHMTEFNSRALWGVGEIRGRFYFHLKYNVIISGTMLLAVYIAYVFDFYTLISNYLSMTT